MPASRRGVRAQAALSYADPPKSTWGGGGWFHALTGAGLIGSLAVLGILIVWLAWGALCGWAAKQKGQSVAVLTIAGLPLAVIDLEQPSIEESVRKRLGLRPADRGGESAILVTCPLVAGPERCTASLNGLSALAANGLICPKA